MGISNPLGPFSNLFFFSYSSSFFLKKNILFVCFLSDWMREQSTVVAGHARSFSFWTWCLLTHGPLMILLRAAYSEPAQSQNNPVVCVFVLTIRKRWETRWRTSDTKTCRSSQSRSVGWWWWFGDFVWGREKNECPDCLLRLSLAISENGSYFRCLSSADFFHVGDQRWKASRDGLWGNETFFPRWIQGE